MIFDADIYGKKIFEKFQNLVYFKIFRFAKWRPFCFFFRIFFRNFVFPIFYPTIVEKCRKSCPKPQKRVIGFFSREIRRTYHGYKTLFGPQKQTFREPILKIFAQNKVLSHLQ